MRRLGRLGWFALILTATAIVVAPPAALAACHAFTVEAEPDTAAEGTEVTVTVTRDAAVVPSSVDISSMDETAQAEADYEAVERTISFTGDEVEQSFALPLFDDPDPEPAETFLLHLSNGDGCEVNTNFQYGPDAQVTIDDNDAPATTAAPTPPPETEAPPTTPAPAKAGKTTTTAKPPKTEPSTSTTAATTTTTEEDEALATASVEASDGGGPSGGAIATGVLATIAVLGTGGYVFYRRRAGSLSPPT